MQCDYIFGTNSISHIMFQWDPLLKTVIVFSIGNSLPGEFKKNLTKDVVNMRIRAVDII